jgi:DNA-binding transcriptional regulator YiaG
MPNVMSALKSEISRLAKKEANAIVAPVRKINAAQRGLIAGLRRQVDAMQKELSGLKKAVPAPVAVIPAKEAPEGRFWITGKGVKTLRKKLGLTQAQFAKLVGVSNPTVGNWEGTEGKVDIRRKATMARLQEVKSMGKKQAALILGLGKGKAEKPKAKEKAAPKAKKLPGKTSPQKRKAVVGTKSKRVKASRAGPQG